MRNASNFYNYNFAEKKAYGYVRISKEDRSKNEYELHTSIMNQIKDITSFCADRKVTLVHVYKDADITGSEEKRPEFQAMLADVQARKDAVDFIITTTQSRFARSSRIIKDTLAMLTVASVKLWVLADARFADALSMQTQVHTFVDELYITDLKEKSARLADRKEEEGLPISPPPFGYDMNKVSHNWVVNSEKAAIVKKVFEDFVQGTSISEIARARKFNTRRVHLILKNKSYTGILRYKHVVRDSGNKVVGYEPAREYKAKFRAIIDEATYERAQRILANQKSRSRVPAAVKEVLNEKRSE